MRPATIIDKIFIRLVLFLIIYIIVGFYTGDNFSAVASGLLCIFILELFSKIMSKHPGKRKIKRTELKNNINLQQQLIFNEDENYDIFLNALNKYGALKEKDFIKFKKDGKDCAAFLNFSYEQLSKQQLLEYYKNSKKLKIDICIIFTSKISEDSLLLLNNFKDVEIKVFSDFEVYSFLKRKGALPKINPLIKEKRDFSKIIKRAFARKNFKGFFMCGIFLFLFSFITPFKLYYRISSILLFFAALVCLVRPYKKLSDDF